MFYGTKWKITDQNFVSTYFPHGFTPATQGAEAVKI